MGRRGDDFDCFSKSEVTKSEVYYHEKQKMILFAGGLKVGDVRIILFTTKPSMEECRNKRKKENIL